MRRRPAGDGGVSVGAFAGPGGARRHGSGARGGAGRGDLGAASAAASVTMAYPPHLPPNSTANARRGARSTTGYRDMTVNISYEGHVCELQIELAAMLEVKYDAHKAYELIRSLDLEGDLEATPTRLTDLADACSPTTHVVLGGLRLVTATFSSLVATLYIAFGLFYDDDTTNFVGVWVYGDANVSGVFFAAFLAPPFAAVAVVALRDLLRQVATVYVEAPCQKRAIQLMLVGMHLFFLVLFVLALSANPVAPGETLGPFLALVALSIVVYAWATVPTDMDAVMKRSRLGLLYDKYFGLNGQVRAWVTKWARAWVRAGARARAWVRA